METISGWALAAYGKEFLKYAGELIKHKYEDEKEQNEALQALERRWINFNWGKSAERYKTHLQKIHGYIRVIGTTEPIPIGDIFTDVYILDKPQAYRRFDVTRLHEIQKEPGKLDEDIQRERGLKIVVSWRGHRLYILGKPGAGKTTFLKYLVHQTIVADELNKLPIFITLREWDARETELLDFIVQQFEICNFPDAKPFIEYLLKTGKAIVLFDGLDEVPLEGDRRAETVQALHDFSRTYLETQIAITCRVAASDYSFTEFTYIEMADFSEAQVEAYARNWFRKDPDTAKRFLKELNLEENRGVRDLGRSPLLLSMICLAYEATLDIPKRRVELYEEALDALLKKWDSSRKIRRDTAYKALSLGRKKQMFARLAAAYFDKGIIFFPKKEVARKIEEYLKSLPPDAQSGEPDGEALLEAISAQHGILVERAKGIYAFSHLTFQEYYTAKYIAENAHRGTLEALSVHLNDSRWREVFLLTASLLDDATPLFQAMQNSAQEILAQDTNLLHIQRWAVNHAESAPNNTQASLRSLYWVLLLNLVYAHVLDRDRDLARARALALDLDLDRALDLSLDHGLYLSLEFARAHARAFALDLARDIYLARDIAHTLALDLTHDLDLFFKKPHPSAHQFPDFFETTLNKTNLLLISQLLRISPAKERTKVRVEKLSKLLDKAQEATSPPAPHTSKRVWRNFHQVIRKNTEVYLGLDFDKVERIDAEIALNYLKANRPFLDCLQVATVEDRAAVEDMILNIPEGWKPPTS